MTTYYYTASAPVEDDVGREALRFVPSEDGTPCHGSSKWIVTIAPGNRLMCFTAEGWERWNRRISRMSPHRQRTMRPALAFAAITRIDDGEFTVPTGLCEHAGIKAGSSAVLIEQEDGTFILSDKENPAPNA